MKGVYGMRRQPGICAPSPWASLSLGVYLMAFSSLIYHIISHSHLLLSFFYFILCNCVAIMEQMLACQYLMEKVVLVCGIVNSLPRDNGGCENLLCFIFFL